MESQAADKHGGFDPLSLHLSEKERQWKTLFCLWGKEIWALKYYAVFVKG